MLRDVMLLSIYEMVDDASAEVFEFVDGSQNYASPASGKFPARLVAISSSTDEDAFVWEPPVWYICTKPYSILLSSRRVIETESILNQFRANLLQEFARLKSYSVHAEDTSAVVAELSELRFARESFLKGVDRDTLSHQARLRARDSWHDGLVATCELELTECACHLIALQSLTKERRPSALAVSGSTLGDQQFVGKCAELVVHLMFSSSGVFMNVPASQRGYPCQPFPCTCFGDVWTALKDLCALTGNEGSSCGFDLILDAAIRKILDPNIPKSSQPSFVGSGDQATFCWWFLASLIGDSEVPPKKVLDTLRVLTLNETSPPPEENLRLLLMLYLRCTRNAVDQNVPGALLPIVFKAMKTTTTLTPGGDMASFLSRVPCDATTWESVARNRVRDPLDVEGAHDSFSVFLHILAKHRSWKDFRSRLKFRMNQMKLHEMNEFGWVRMLDLYLTLVVDCDDKPSVIKDFVAATKNFSLLTTSSGKVKSGSWEVVVRGLWAFLVAVGDCPPASEPLIVCLNSLVSCFIDAVAKQNDVTVLRHAHNSLVEHFVGLGQFLKQSEKGPMPDSASLLPTCPPVLFAKLARLGGQKFLTAVLDIVRFIKISAEKHLPRKAYSVEEGALADSTSDWIRKLFERVWEPVRSLTYVDKEAMALSSVPVAAVGEICVELTLIEAKDKKRVVLPAMLDVAGSSTSRVHPVVVCSYLCGLLDEGSSVLDVETEISVYSAWLRCRLLMPSFYWGRAVDMQNERLDELVERLPLASRACKSSFASNSVDEEALFSCDVRGHVDENRGCFWKRLVVGFNRLFIETQDDEDVAKLPRVFANVGNYLKVFDNSLDKYFAAGRSRDAVVDRAVEVATFLVTDASSVLLGKDGRNVMAVTSLVNFIYLTPTARSFGVLLHRDLLEIVGTHLPDVVTSLSEAVMRNPSLEVLKGMVQEIFFYYIVRFPQDGRHPLLKALLNFVGELMVEIFFVSVGNILSSANRTSLEKELVVKFVHMFFDRRGQPQICDLACSRLFPKLANASAFLTESKPLVERLFSTASFETLRTMVSEYLSKNLAFLAPKCKALLALVGEVRPEVLDSDEVRQAVSGSLKEIEKLRGRREDGILRDVYNMLQKDV